MKQETTTREERRRTFGRDGSRTGASRRGAAVGLVLLLALAAGCGGGDGEGSSTLTVVSWGGSYGRASARAFHGPFSAETGVPIVVEDYNGGLAQIRAQVETGNVYWDVVDMEIADATRACDEGLLEPVAPDSLPPGLDGTPAISDFAEGTITECGVGTLFYSTVYAYSTETYPEGAPTTIADFFDLERFPGRRGMRRSPLANLEFALMADGVAPEDVYATLDAPEGVERALAKLDAIADQVIWWETGAQPPQMLADGEVVMTTGWNGRLFNAQVLEGQPFEIVWDGQLLDFGLKAVVAGSRNIEAARRYIGFATSAEALAAISRIIAYSPVRTSALPRVTTHVDEGVAMAPHLPTSPQHLEKALRSDFRWWADNLDDMNERFSAWLAAR